MINNEFNYDYKCGKCLTWSVSYDISCDMCGDGDERWFKNF